MRAIKTGKRVVGDGMTLLIDRDAAAVAIAQKYTDCRDVRKLREQGTVLRRIAPRKNGNADDRLERGSFIFHAVIPSEETVLIGVDSLHRPFPGTNLLFKHATNVRNGMKAKMTADVFVAEPGTKEKRRRVDGAASADDSFAANAHAVAPFRTRFDAGCRTGLDSNPQGARLDDESSAMLLRIREPGFRRRLLGAESAAVTAVTTNFSLVAADYIAGHRVDVPSESAQAAIQDLFAVRDAIVIAIDVQSFAHRVEASRVFVAREPRHSRRGPFSADVVGRSKRRTVVDDCRAAEAFAGKQTDAVIGGGGETRFGVETLKTAELGAVEVVVIVITAGLKNDNVLPCRSKNGRGGAAASAGTNDANVTRQIHLTIRKDYFERARRRSLWRAKGAWVVEIVPDLAAAAVLRRQHDVEKADRFSKRLKCGAALAHAAVCPGKQNADTVLLGKIGETFQAANGEKAVEARIPKVKKLKKLCAVLWARVEIHRGGDGFGDAQFQRGGPAVCGWQKRFANGFEGSLLSKSEIQSSALT